MKLFFIYVAQFRVLYMAFLNQTTFYGTSVCCWRGCYYSAHPWTYTSGYVLLLVRRCWFLLANSLSLLLPSHALLARCPFERINQEWTDRSVTVVSLFSFITMVFNIMSYLYNEIFLTAVRTKYIAQWLISNEEWHEAILYRYVSINGSKRVWTLRFGSVGRVW